MRSSAESIYSSSSSSFEIIDISHSFPPNRSGIATFFTAPSERRLRRRRSNRLLKHNNSSSESVGDLAYGHGYLRRPKRKIRSRKGKEIDRERYTERERERERVIERDREKYSDREREKSGIGRVATDAGILAVGAGLAKLARDQNKFDLKNAARNGKQVYAAKEFGQQNDGPSRGLGPSKVSHGSDTVDEDGWESASDAESNSSIDSRLAFGAESQGGWGFFGRKKNKPQSRKNSVVDPRLFGPENSLHGVVTQPVGFGEVSWASTSDFGEHPFAVPPAASVASGSQPPMRHVYPIPTDDSTRFDVAGSSVISGPEPYVSSRPGPIPIQQPQPITPVSQSVYEPIYGTRSETGTGILKKTPTSSGRSKSLAEAALFGVAGAAIGAAITDRKDDRKERRRDDDGDEDRPLKRWDSERKDAKDDRKWNKKDSSDRDDRKEKGREKERIKDSPDDRKDKKREKRRDDTREETRDERRERRREERRSERGDDRYDDRKSEHSDIRYDSRRSNSDTIVSKTSVDPFQYQVENDAFATPNNEPVVGHDRVQSVPTVVTVEREPDFTRKRSSSIKDIPVSSRSEPGRRDYADERDSRVRDPPQDSRDRKLHEAESIYQEAEHFTAPIGAAAISAAIAAEGYRESRSERRRDERRGERRSDYDDYDGKPSERESRRDSKDYDDDDRKSRHRDSERDYDDYDRKPRDREATREPQREPDRDPIQEEADRAYREIVMARKIASQVIRSRTPSPNRSVVDKYEGTEEEEIVRIVTPPGMDDHKKKGLYDAPNADFEIDHVLEDPREIRRFSLPSSSRSRSNSETVYLKKDPDASQPRPLLNLVLPTPSPSPLPEKQLARSEPARPSKPEIEAATTAASEVVTSPKGNVVPSVTASTVSKGVTWGENETKHFEVESPSEHRDEFVTTPEMKAREVPVQEPKKKSRDSSVEQPTSTNGSKRSGWGAIAAGIIGASGGAIAANSSDTSKSSKSFKPSKPKDDEKKDDTPYEYRGVVVEPESPPRSRRQRSPPTTGPKPSNHQASQSSHIPGAFDDDLDFTATVAAGLQDTGFDPNIVINDPNFRRRESPPGSNGGPSLYHAPYAETVSDFGSVMKETGSARDGQGFVIGEVTTTPRDWPTVSPDENDASSKLSKKELKKREKAKRESGDFTPVEENFKSKDLIEKPDSYFETKLSKKDQKKRDREARRQDSQVEDAMPLDERSVGAEIVEEPESYFDELTKKSKKSKKGSSSYDQDAEDTLRDRRKVSVPVDAFDDLRNGEDDWSEIKKSKRGSKRDSDRYDSPSRSALSDVASPLERTSSLSKKSKDKPKHKSDSYEANPTEVSLPPSTPSENSRDGDFDDLRRSRKSSNKDNADRGESHSVVSADASRYDDDEPRKSKRKSKSRDDFDDTRSVASAPAGDDYDDKKNKRKNKDKKNNGGLFGLFGSKSEVEARDDNPKRSKDDFEDVKKKSKKSKRSSMPDASSLYGDLGSQSVGDLPQIASNGNSNGNGAYHYDDDRERDKLDETSKTSRTRDESESSKKDSFLAKAGTLGAGVGLAGAAVAIAAQRHQQSIADNAYESNRTAEQSRSRSSSQLRPLEETLDPEITRRQFRPSIDPQYGDLLPLPPSDPVSPNVEPMEDLPDLPDSRPNTPEEQRLAKERAMASVRKSIHDNTPMKSPSHSAVPLKFIMGNRSNPSSPGSVRSSPLQSPATSNQDSLQFPRTRPRPTSWDSTKEYKPLYLVESNRRGSNVQQQEVEVPLPALPPSQRTSRSSSQLDSSDDATFEDAEQYPRDMQVRFAEPLSIDTGLAKSSTELLDSQQSTPKASVFQYLDADQSDEQLPQHSPVGLFHTSSLPAQRSVSPELEEYHDSHSDARIAAEVIAGTALVSSIGHFATSPIRKPTDISFSDVLPSHPDVQPSSVDPMTKDRSSYLLQSSPMSRKTEGEESAERIEDSPTSRQQPSDFAADALQSIKERDRTEDREWPGEVQPLIEQERERTLDTLSGSTQDQPVLQETKEVLLNQEVDLAAIDTKEEIEPAEEFALPKSKKDKKKGKKQSKVISSPSTQDDITLPEPSPGDFEVPSAFVDAETSEELSLPKSKKDKKKSKLSQSSTQDDFSIGEPSREIIEQVSTSANVVPMEEFWTPKSKKDKKKDKMKDKKKGKSVMTWEPEEEPEISTPEEALDTIADVPVLEEVPVQDDFDAAESKKSGKKNKKSRKSMAIWEPDDERTSSAPVDEPTHENIRSILETAVPEGLGIAAYEISKPSDEPTSSIHLEDHNVAGSKEPTELNVFDFQDQERSPHVIPTQSAVPQDTRQELLPEITPDIIPEAHREVNREVPQETSTPEESFIPASKKIKKKRNNKLASTWEYSEEQEVPPPPVQEAEATEGFSIPASKKSRKKGKKSQSWTPEEAAASEQQESIELPSEAASSRELPIAKSEEQSIDESDQFATPGWTATPATPWATANEEVPQTSRTDYFPFSTPPHSPAKPQLLDDTKGRDSFPSAASIAPLAAVGAAILAADDLDQKSDDGIAPEDFTSRNLERAPLPTEPDSEFSRPAPDGLKAGYDSDQLSLARQLQEEFGSGSKNSKTDKRKRQSLPTTSDRNISRSRELDEASEDHHRARSLSVRPLPGIERSADRPMSEDRKNVYSEDQLELARQLKAEFEGGNKKSKKDKKKRQGLSQTSTQDDAVVYQSTEDPPGVEPETLEHFTARDPTQSARDGFEAGYQEDQISLARQLQAEFGSGSKKSKKNNKQRSTSQTPIDESESQIDYFGDTSRIPTEELPRDLVSTNTPEVIRLDKDVARDGLAVGYNEDQLALARQLKDEFSPGSKKSKKDKKKRQSLLRNTNEDDFSSDYTPNNDDASRDIESLNEPAPVEPISVEPQDDFTFTSKKSKKDKKGKKRENILPSATDDTFSETTTKELEDPLNLDNTQEKNLALEADASVPAEPEAEFSSATKSKNDKKGKKRLLAAKEDEFREETTTSDFPQTAEAETRVQTESDWLPAENAEEEFGLTRKKSKKDKKGKKRENFLHSNTDDASSSDNFGKAVEALHGAREDFFEEAESGEERVTASFDDDWSSAITNSKKDKEKRQSLAAQEDSWQQPAAEGDPKLFHASEDQSTPDVTVVSSAIDDAAGEFGLPTKKLKKDKNKRQSLLRSSSTYDDPPEEPIEEVIRLQESAAQEIGNDTPALAPASNEQDDRFELASKKSKKDKKKRSGVQAGSFVDETIRSLDESSPALPEQPVEETGREMQDPVVETANLEAFRDDTTLEDKTLEPQAEPEENLKSQFENFAFTSKKSKKDRTGKDSAVRDFGEPSGVSIPMDPIEAPTPMHGPTLPTENEARSVEAFEEPSTREIGESVAAGLVAGEVWADPADEWGSFSTKKSKKDKKKRKSGFSTPNEEFPMGIETPKPENPAVVEEPKEISEQLPDPVEDEWSSSTTKKSKRDKKNRKSGLSTPNEDAAVQAAVFPTQESVDVETPTEVIEQAEDAVDDDRGSTQFKKSEKEKRKSKSGFSTPLEETVPETEVTRGITGTEEPKSEQVEDLLDSEWGSFTTKKSKKDKKKNKTGPSTPLESTLEPQSMISDDVPDETFAQLDHASQPEFQQTKELDLAPEEPLDDGWGSFTTKKNKKGKKNKSGLSTPLETFAEPKTTDSQHDVPQAEVEEPKSQLEELLAGGAFTTKKSQDEKKRLEFEMSPEGFPQAEASLQGTQPMAEQQAEETMPQQAEEEWGSFTTQKSKKDKKKKSDLSSPIEEVPLHETTQGDRVSMPMQETLQPESATERNFVETKEPQAQVVSTEHDILTAQIDEADEAFDYVTPKSKKDKKKRKSGFSTPIEETEPAIESFSVQQIDPDTSETQPLPTGPMVESFQDSSETAFDFVSKKSKKEKKKRHSGLSTPIEETLPPRAPESSSRDISAVTTSGILPSERDMPESQTLQNESQAPLSETFDDGFEFATKKSKKDKKGKRSSRIDSESDPSSSATPSTAPRMDMATEDQAHLASERSTQSPISFGRDTTTEQNIGEENPQSVSHEEVPLETQATKNDDIPLDLRQKPSKKDKRKRTTTVANIIDNTGTSQTPVTSWADEVEEAEVEREVPVIQDIAKDESLSHIASTTEAAPVDDFSRPTKKGKKGKKRNSGLTRESSMDESFRPPTGKDSQAEQLAEHSNIPVLAATGAALAGAAFLADRSGEDHTQPAKSVVHDETSVDKDADVPPPARKLSKKEKRKQSIDRRAPRDDPFDDPALWEGSESRAFEESREGNEDTGSNAFWSAPNHQQETASEELYHAPSVPHEGSVNPFAATRNEQTEDPGHDVYSKNDGHQSKPAHNLPRPEQQWNDLPDEYITTPSKKDKKKKKQSRVAAWDTPQEPQDLRDIDPSTSHSPTEPSRAIDEPRDIEERMYTEQRPATAVNDFVEESPVDKDIFFQNDQFQPRSSLRYSHLGSSSLPAVREESPAHMDPEHFKPPSYAHGTEDFNRDSAFVADSPIPGQRPFADEHIRDSGVHLRESSPMERTVAPASTTDDAIARLSWPAVDEESEAVDLHRSQRPKLETPTTNRGIGERISVKPHQSHAPHIEDRDFRQSHALEEDNLHRHHEDRDLLPSQKQVEESHTDLHRTQTIRRSPLSEDGRPHRHRVHRSHEPEDEKPYRYEQSRDLPSQMHEGEVKQPRHRVHRSHTSEEPKPDPHRRKDRSLPPEHVEDHSDLRRTQTLHQSQKPDSHVRQRVQRIESPDLPRSHTGKGDKYGDIITSQQPKADKAKTISDNANGTAAAIAGATVGFAAARQVSRENRPGSAQSQRSSPNINRLRTPDSKTLIHRPESVGSNRSTPPLRRSDRKSGDLRSLSQRSTSNLDLNKEAELAAITAAAAEASTTVPPANPQANEGRVRAKEMADVYVGQK